MRNFLMRYFGLMLISWPSFLQDLVKKTPHGHPDYHNLTKALKEMVNLLNLTDRAR